MHDISFLAKLTILLVVLAIVVFGPPVNAQLVPHDSFDGQLDDVFLMPDRSRLLWMRRAEDMIAEQQYSNAVRLLAQILDSDSDYFVRGPDGATFTSFKRRAEQMIGALPEKGREAYISLFGAVADRQLTEAVTSSEIQGLVECSRRYFHTEAGAKATWLLGLHYIDHGQPLTAVTVLRRLQRNAAAGQLEPKLSLTLTLALRRAGLDKPARDAAGEMRLRFPDARFDVQGQSIPIFANEKRAFDWLAGIGGMPVRHATGPQVESWLPQGNASGTPTFDADRPVSIARWSLPVAESRETVKKIARLETELATHDPPVVALPSAQPLAVGDYIIVRTLDALMAIDFKTGKRAFPLAMNSVEDVHTASDRLFGEPQEATDLLSLERQLIDDSGSSKFSSDGENVYLVSTQSHLRAPHELFLPNPELPRRNTGKEFNWLEAHDLQSDGKLLWTLGGPATSGNPLAGALFLGPPLPLDGVLYCLVEWNGAIELVAIQPQPDHSSVSVLWKQHLAAASHRYGSQANRRLLGATPSFSDGFLVCPTSSGAVVTVDLSTRSLQWGFKYDQAPTILLSRAQQIHAGRAANRFDRWMDATAIIKDGRVFLTPPFSNRLYCLDLISGALLWDVPRNQGLFIAATTAEAVFVCGTKQIEVFGIGEGARIATIPFPSRVAPSGRGLQTIDSYLLPMTNGEIAKIDLAAATMAERISLRGIAGQPGPVVGNLVAFKGSIVSQSLRGVDCFHQLGHLKQRSAATLAQTPDDAEALTAAAIVQLESGQRAAAIDLLQKSAQQGAGELTRVLLVNNLRAMIREDFAGNQNLNDQVDRLLVTTEERSAFLRDVAHGLYTTGEYRASFEVYLEISDLVWEELERGEHELRELETHWQVREDRFLAARLKTLYRLADRADQAYMDELIGTRLQQLLESLASSSNAARESSARSVASLSYFVTCFSDHPAANTARLRLAEVIRNVDPANLDVELLLRRVLRSGDEQQRTEALVGITDWYLDNDNAVMAQVTGELLLKQDSVPGQSPSTGYAASFRDEITGVLRRLTAATKQDEIHDGWGAWDKQSPQQANTINVGHLRPLSDGGSLAPSDFDSKTGQMFLDVQNAGSLVQLDAMGRTAWTLPVDRAMGVRRYLAPTAYRFQTLGQLRLVSMGDRLLSIGSTGQSAAVLGEDVFSATILGASPRDVHMRSLLHGWGEDRYYLTDTRGRALGEMALLSEDCLCILQGEDVVARHPILKGKAYWSRRVSGSAERLFGSQDHLFVTVGEQATIYSTADGRVLGERDVPPDNEIMTTLGDAVVRWTNLENGRVRIALVDCWKGSLDDPAVIWQHEFATGTKARLVSSRQLAVLERSGRFRVLDMATGDAKLESQLRPDEELNRIFVMVHGDMLVLIANTNEAFKQDRAVSVPLPAAPGSVRVNGWIYGINLNKGEKTWEKRVGEHGIWLGQPSGLPVLTLACVANLRKQGQQLRATSVLIIDKRNGAVIHEDDAVMSAASSYQISGDPDTRTVTLDLAGSSSLLFHFQEPIHQPIKSPEN